MNPLLSQWDIPAVFHKLQYNISDTAIVFYLLVWIEIKGSEKRNALANICICMYFWKTFSTGEEQCLRMADVLSQLSCPHQWGDFGLPWLMATQEMRPTRAFCPIMQCCTTTFGNNNKSADKKFTYSTREICCCQMGVLWGWQLSVLAG